MSEQTGALAACRAIRRAGGGVSEQAKSDTADDLVTALEVAQEDLAAYRAHSVRYGPFEDAVKALWWRMHPVIYHEDEIGMFVSLDELDGIKAAYAALRQAGAVPERGPGFEVVIGPREMGASTRRLTTSTTTTTTTGGTTSERADRGAGGLAWGD